MIMDYMDKETALKFKEFLDRHPITKAYKEVTDKMQEVIDTKLKEEGEMK